MTIQEINKEINRLNQLKVTLLEQRIEEKKKISKECVGKYFYHNIYEYYVPVIGVVQDVDIDGELETIELSYDEDIPSIDGHYMTGKLPNKLNFISKEEFMSMLDERLKMIRETWERRVLTKS